MQKISFPTQLLLITVAKALSRKPAKIHILGDSRFVILATKKRGVALQPLFQNRTQKAYSASENTHPGGLARTSWPWTAIIGLSQILEMKTKLNRNFMPS